MIRVTAYYDDEDLHRIFRACFGAAAEIEAPDDDAQIEAKKLESGEWSVSYDVPDNKVGSVQAALTKAGYRLQSRKELAEIAEAQLAASHAAANNKPTLVGKK